MADAPKPAQAAVRPPLHTGPVTALQYIARILDQDRRVQSRPGPIDHVSAGDPTTRGHRHRGDGDGEPGLRSSAPPPAAIT